VQGDHWPGIAEKFIQELATSGEDAAAAAVEESSSSSDDEGDDEPPPPPPPAPDGAPPPAVDKAGKSRAKSKNRRQKAKTAARRPKKTRKFRAPRTTLFGVAVEPDALRDKIDEMFSQMRQDFIYARMVPSCALCHKYFMGHGEDDKVRWRALFDARLFASSCARFVRSSVRFVWHVH
jgi:hypothetical protein